MYACWCLQIPMGLECWGICSSLLLFSQFPSKPDFHLRFSNSNKHLLNLNTYKMAGSMIDTYRENRKLGILSIQLPRPVGKTKPQIISTECCVCSNTNIFRVLGLQSNGSGFLTLGETVTQCDINSGVERWSYVFQAGRSGQGTPGSRNWNCEQSPVHCG
jgi:hypothetical protein